MINQTTLNFAQVLQGQTLSKPEALWYFGNEGEIRNYFGGRRKEFSGNTAKTFKTTLEQYFESVDDTVKVGRGKGYKLGKARAEVAERQDDRENNGGKELPHTKYLDAVILMGIRNRVFECETTLNNWVKNFGLTSEALYAVKTKGLHSKDSVTLREQMASNDVIRSKKNTAELSFYLEDFDNIKGQLKNVLEKMNNAKLIEYYRVPKVKLKTPLERMYEGKMYETYYITIDSATQERISKKKEELKEKYNITSFESHFANRNRIKEERKEDVASYYEELDEFYTTDMYYTDEFGKEVEIEVDYFWFNHAITAKATDNQVQNYLEKKRPEFYEEFLSDEKGFFGNVMNIYEKEKKADVLKKAYKESQRKYEDVLKKHNEDVAAGKKIGKLNMDDEKLLYYWNTNFCINVDNMYPYVKADFRQGNYKL
ncbi:hypothetical protein AALF85_05300 [Jeotgalicoccus halotolerans]|uniref:hypothetical protein n=1 Tax=Jeotgalicoccus halotolerans TaxID=157227 RepID=UPI003514C99C